MSSLDRVRPPAAAPRTRYASAGSLTSGPPLAPSAITPGIWDFRTPILVLALQPIVDPDQFALFLAEELGRLGVYPMACGIHVGEPFWQALPEDNSALEGGLTTVGVSPVVGGGGATAVGLASIFGWSVGAAARRVANANRVIARWITIDGTIDSRSRVTTPDEITAAEVEALNTALRFRHPQSGAMISPQAESVAVRTREPNACTGARRFDKIIAAACTRIEPSSLRPPVVTPASTAPGATRAPPVVRPPEPEPTAAWNGEGTAPPVPSELGGGKTPTGEQGLFTRYRKPIGVTIALVTVAGIAAIFWPKKAPPPPPPTTALPAARRR